MSKKLTILRLDDISILNPSNLKAWGHYNRNSNIYIYIYIYIYIERERERERNVCVCEIYIYIYISKYKYFKMNTFTKVLIFFKNYIFRSYIHVCFLLVAFIREYLVIY